MIAFTTSDLSCSEEHFLKALDIFTRKPNCTNSKVKGAMIMSISDLESGDEIEDEGLIFEEVNSRVIRKLVHKHEGKTSLETLTFTRLPETREIKLKIESDELNFEIVKTKDAIKLLAENSISKPEKELLTRTYFHPLVKWASTDSISATAASVRLVPLDKYSQRYDELKAKYAKKIAEVN